MPQLKDIMKSLNQNKDADLIDEYNQADYVPYVVNRIFSFFPDTIMYANEMNATPFLDRRLQYKYLLYAVRKKSRFSEWLKSPLTDEVKLVKEYFGYSTKKAKAVLPLLSANDLEEIKSILDKGGNV